MPNSIVYKKDRIEASGGTVAIGFEHVKWTDTRPLELHLTIPEARDLLLDLKAFFDELAKYPELDEKWAKALEVAANRKKKGKKDAKEKKTAAKTANVPDMRQGAGGGKD